MGRMEEAQALREDTTRHYNCCQSVVVPYCTLCGISRESALGMAAHFGSGMRHGSTCGAVTGALMVLGLMGADEEKARTLLNEVRNTHGCLDCAHLLAEAKEQGVERKCHCDRLVMESVALLEKWLEM